MSKYFDWPASLKRMVRFDAARAEDVNAALDELTAGVDQIEADIDRLNNAANIYEDFDKRYLGAKASDPALDNQGAALTAGAMYFNTSVNEMRSWNDSAWEAAYLPASGYATEAPSDGNRYARKNTEWEMTDVVQRSARTSNTALSAADCGKWIDVTSGTFTQTFAAATTLGDGWWCYLGNSGTGDITLDPDGAETIDGLASYVMYPGEVRLVQCDGTTLRTIVLSSFSKTFTASGSFVKPPRYSAFGLVVIGAGAGGQCGRRTSGGSIARGGDGGASGGRGELRASADSIAATAAVVVGAGGNGAAGLAVDGSPSNGAAGGDSSVAGVITATGASETGTPGVAYMFGLSASGAAGGAGSASNFKGQAGKNIDSSSNMAIPSGGGGGSCYGASSTGGGNGGSNGVTGEGVRAGGVGGVGTGVVGGDGTNDPERGGTGGGGGAGGAASGTNGGAGGAGGTGAGGGGGGGSNGGTSGAGGAGGSGAVTIWGIA